MRCCPLWSMDHIRANNNLVFGISASCCDRPAAFQNGPTRMTSSLLFRVLPSLPPSLPSERALLSCKTSSAPTFTVFLSDVIIPGGDSCHVDDASCSVEAAFAPKGQFRVPRTSDSVLLLRATRRRNEAMQILVGEAGKKRSFFGHSSSAIIHGSAAPPSK